MKFLTKEWAELLDKQVGNYELAQKNRSWLELRAYEASMALQKANEGLETPVSFDGLLETPLIAVAEAEGDVRFAYPHGQIVLKKVSAVTGDWTVAELAARIPAGVELVAVELYELENKAYDLHCMFRDRAKETGYFYLTITCASVTTILE